MRRLWAFIVGLGRLGGTGALGGDLQEFDVQLGTLFESDVQLLTAFEGDVQLGTLFERDVEF